MSLISKIAACIVGLFSKKTADAILAGIRAASPYISEAMALASMAASIAGGPTGLTIAGVLAAANKLGVQAIIAPGATDAQIGTALRDAVVAALKLKYPNASTADLNRAVELAVGAVKAVQA